LGLKSKVCSGSAPLKAARCGARPRALGTCREDRLLLTGRR
jgi:hypothetical protein